jgi:2-polyprenyl-6-methoxyphenol hydroxylase-like FAD-dependent oxidoreductase
MPPYAGEGINMVMQDAIAAYEKKCANEMAKLKK